VAAAAGAVLRFVGNGGGASGAFADDSTIGVAARKRDSIKVGCYGLNSERMGLGGRGAKGRS